MQVRHNRVNTTKSQDDAGVPHSALEVRILRRLLYGRAFYSVNRTFSGPCFRYKGKTINILRHNCKMNIPMLIYVSSLM